MASERRGIAFETRLLTGLVATVIPCAAVAGVVIAGSEWSAAGKIGAALALAGATTGIALFARRRTVFPLQTLASLLAALREGDFSVRGTGARPGDALGEAIAETNALADNLKSQRFAALEATSLLRTVMSEIEVAILVFDPQSRLRLANRAAERLLAQPAERLIGQSAAELALEDCLAGETHRTVERAFPGERGRFSVRRSFVREGGEQHAFLAIANLSTALREEERAAWRRLIRVLGHELNNSLAPIRSIAESLSRRVAAPEIGPEAREDLARGLAVVRDRAASLARFLEGYAKLARLPAPRPSRIALAPLLVRTTELETRVRIDVAPGPDVVVDVDPDQLQQALINLLKNAAEAALETGGGVRMSWAVSAGEVEVRIEDDGPGLADPGNLFVPFFTTKPEGTGLGLPLARQIAEALGGSVSLENRRDRPGCVARVRLPLGAADASVE